MGQTEVRKWRGPKGNGRKDMTKDFIKTAQTRRLDALEEMDQRESNGQDVRKLRRLPPLTQSHIDALFQTSKRASNTATGFLAA